MLDLNDFKSLPDFCIDVEVLFDYDLPDVKWLVKMCSFFC